MQGGHRRGGGGRFGGRGGRGGRSDGMGKTMFAGRGSQQGGQGYQDASAEFMVDPSMDPGFLADPSFMGLDPLALMAGVGRGGPMGLNLPGFGMPQPPMGPRPPPGPPPTGPMGPMDASLSAVLGPPPSADLLGMPPIGPMPPLSAGFGGRGPMGLGMGFGGGMGGMPGMGGPMGRGGGGGADGAFGMMGMPGLMGGGMEGSGMRGSREQQQQQAEKNRNDYSQNFVDTGQRPQNYLRDSHLTDRYEEYPKLKELINRKTEQIKRYNTPPYFLKADLKSLKLSPETFGTKFDVILVDPPWEEYVRRAPNMLKDSEWWPWQDIQALELEAIADTPSFLFLWCGSEEGLEAGRVCMQKWGFRRCEDIVWIKTNKEGKGRKYLQPTNQLPDSVLVHTKEHCIMGIRGTVRRATDGHIIHANVDTDVMVSEEPELGSTQKPEELYDIIERFANGRRRLELFGEDHNIRPGWVTVGKSLSTSNFNPRTYADHFRNRDGSVYVCNTYGAKPPPGAPVLLPSSDEIEELRPKSPPPSGGRG